MGVQEITLVVVVVHAVGNLTLAAVRVRQGHRQLKYLEAKKRKK